MKILYYCPEYYYRHGGRTHARGFFGALDNLPSVSGKFLFPKSSPSNDTQNNPVKTRTRGRLWFLPPTMERVVRYFMPRRDLTRALISEIHAHECDALVIRIGMAQPSIKDINRACPDTTICVEINAAGLELDMNPLLRSLLQRWEVRRYNRADAITVVSSHIKTYLESRGICSDKILVNPNGVDIETITPIGITGIKDKYGIPEDAFVIGYIGGMEAFRRLPEVVGYIADMWRDGHDDIYFLIVGDGNDMPAIRAAVESNSDVLGNAVKCVGWQEYSEIPKLLSTFDLAIFPFTNAYCSPLKIFEYLGAGVPTIGPDTPAVREAFQDNVHLKLVKQDGSNFIETILEMKDNPKLRMELAQNGQQLVLNEYTWEINARRVVEHIENRRRQ